MNDRQKVENVENEEEEVEVMRRREKRFMLTQKAIHITK